MKAYLIITTGHINEEQRIKDYIESFKTVDIIAKHFDKIFIVECISKEKISYLENTSFDVYYSTVPNTHKNKGYNQYNHVQTFLKDSTLINDQDIIIMLTGRYFLENNNFIKTVFELLRTNKINIVAKTDGDLWPRTPDLGVHTFYTGFTKESFINFFKWYLELGEHNKGIEWEVRRYMEANKNTSVILPRDIKLGVISNQVNGYKGAHV